ncbi:MAG: GNAT family N-acetyltransferase [Holophaga sp.]|jgi:GNAT superfamily N-acetyltransferase
MSQPQASTHVLPCSGPGGIQVRDALPGEFQALGELLVRVYSALEGFPKPEEQPRYYDMLRNIGQMTQKPCTRLLVAVAGGTLLGGVVYFSDMTQYGSGGTATRETGASGFRLLGVDPAARGKGAGRALMEACIAQAREDGNAQVIIHSTKAMAVAWRMYEARGFQRSTDLDFMQEKLQVYGFRLKL